MSLHVASTMHGRWGRLRFTSNTSCTWLRYRNTQRTRTRHVTSHMRPARCSSTNGRTTYSPNSDASAVRACAVTLNKEIRVCRGGGDLVAKETVRSARSKEECVQSGPRSRDFAVKDAADKNKERKEDGARPHSPGAAEILELLRGESRL